MISTVSPVFFMMDMKILGGTALRTPITISCKSHQSYAGWCIIPRFALSRFSDPTLGFSSIRFFYISIIDPVFYYRIWAFYHINLPSESLFISKFLFFAIPATSHAVFFPLSQTLYYGIFSGF
jgi:hypothetical protein